jgi:CheY-like chemotaxis protein
MDVQLPGMDGIEATERLRARGYAGQIVALTAHAMPEDRERCLGAGMNEYLSKPVQMQRLRETLAGVEAGRLIAGERRSSTRSEDAGRRSVSDDGE